MGLRNLEMKLGQKTAELTNMKANIQANSIKCALQRAVIGERDANGCNPQAGTLDTVSALGPYPAVD
jgi:hypothetical protein